MGKMGPVELFLLLSILLLYFLPSFIALMRKKTNRAAIILLNIFLGWTFIGWIVSLIWACTSNAQLQTVVVNNTNYSKEENSQDQPKIDFDDKLNNIQKLKELLDSGALSQEEFEEQKTKLLAS